VTSLLLYDDLQARGFEPFASTRPLGEMAAGALPIRERWQRVLGIPCSGFISRPELADFEEEGAPPAAAGGTVGDFIVASSRFAPMLRGETASAGGSAAGSGIGRWMGGGDVVAVRLEGGTDLRALRDGRIRLSDLTPLGSESETLEGWTIDRVWDLVRLLPEILATDVADSGGLATGTASLPRHVTVLGDGPVSVAPGVELDPFVVLDARGGGIVIEAGATIHSFARIVGPCYVGRKATIMGGDVSGCSIGPVSKVRGEISSSVVLGYSNKGHDGFVGNSYLGRWVNLGAGTVTSNLKNTYSQVEMWTPDGVRPTGMQFLGTLFGDHAKTGIGLMLTTGTVIGTGANVFEKMPPKAVAPFSWGSGEPYTTYRLDKFLDVAERVMARRSVALTAGMRRLLTAAHEARWSPNEGEDR
jgi:UDP-N-acetylglucosamine diphosphorylase / glucose-1-phosphate thymidylyltransferase / UDP-N-acetylgalactosamine diphosphorylase / glucosamine-1-phosphate N-acetyltransferase / galactosamine-1-phosphate N-acetyltransferase